MVGAGDASVALAASASTAGARRRLLRDASVYREGSEPDLVWFIHDGLVKLETTDAGGAMSLVAFRGPGEWLGEHAAVDGRPRMTAAVVVRDATVSSLRRDDFVESVRADPELAVELLSSFVGQLRQAVEHELQLASGDPTVLVAHRLTMLASDARFASTRAVRSGQVSIDMPISHEELATWAGVSRRSVETALQHFRSVGAVSTGRMRVDVHDLDALEAFAHPSAGSTDSVRPGTTD